MLDRIISIVILLGLLWVLLAINRTNKKLDKISTKMKSEKEMTRKQVEKEMEELNETIKTN